VRSDFTFSVEGVLKQNNMARSQNSFIKKQLEKKKQQKKQDKEQRKQERQENSAGGGLENMMAYVDEFGRISSTPPEVKKEKEIKKEKDPLPEKKKS
jgi:hypothetical protein